MPYSLGQESRDSWDTFCFFEEAFTPEECEKIIELGVKLETAPAVISGEGIQNPEKRKTTVSWISWSVEVNWIFEKLEKIVHSANLRYRFNLSAFLEAIQFTQYLEPNDHYEWHQDSGPGRFAIRKLSIVVQLSDEASYTGGDLEFFMVKREPLRKRGTVFVFPSFEVHRVTPLLSGQRRYLVAWVSGPPYA